MSRKGGLFTIGVMWTIGAIAAGFWAGPWCGIPAFIGGAYITGALNQ